MVSGAQPPVQRDQKLVLCAPIAPYFMIRGMARLTISL